MSPDVFGRLVLSPITQRTLLLISTAMTTPLEECSHWQLQHFVREMGSTASIQSEQFEKLKVEFESKKDTLSDEELFNHMKVFYEALTAATATATAEPSATPAAAAQTPP
jgi:hypothetical protein